MDLIQLKNYLQTRKISPLPDIALHFRVDRETVKPLLDIWVNKGKARRHQGGTGTCKGCCKCDPSSLESYEWID